MAGEIAIRAIRPELRDRPAADRLVLAVLRDHADSLLRVARRHSLCADDAQDAYQRAVEIFLRHAQTLDAEAAHKWLHTVLKHEAMRLRASRARSVGSEDVDLDVHEARQLPTADEQVSSFDRMSRSAEALQRLKPQERQALWLKAQGHSYEEIAELCNWTYTKVNRCITEGRRSFLDRYADIGSGAECRRWEPMLSALVDGEAGPMELTAIRPHLRNCPACRARVRALRESALGIAALLPAPVLFESRPHSGLLTRFVESVTSTVHDRIALSAAKLQAGAEAALPGKLAAVAAGAAAIAGGGVAVEQAVRTPRPQRAAHIAQVKPVVRADIGVRAASRPAAAPAVARPAAKHVSRRAAARRTAKAEFGVSDKTARASSANTTASREFARPQSTASVAATSPRAAVPSSPPAGASKAEKTAAAEFGGG